MIELNYVFSTLSGFVKSYKLSNYKWGL